MMNDELLVALKKTYTLSTLAQLTRDFRHLEKIGHVERLVTDHNSVSYRVVYPIKFDVDGTIVILEKDTRFPATFAAYLKITGFAHRAENKKN